jgi:hypothetical protein
MVELAPVQQSIDVSGSRVKHAPHLSHGGIPDVESSCSKPLSLTPGQQPSPASGLNIRSGPQRPVLGRIRHSLMLQWLSMLLHVGA